MELKHHDQYNLLTKQPLINRTIMELKLSSGIVFA